MTHSQPPYFGATLTLIVFPRCFFRCRAHQSFLAALCTVFLLSCLLCALSIFGPPFRYVFFNCFPWVPEPGNPRELLGTSELALHFSLRKVVKGCSTLRYFRLGGRNTQLAFFIPPLVRSVEISPEVFSPKCVLGSRYAFSPSLLHSVPSEISSIRRTRSRLFVSLVPQSFPKSPFGRPR